MYLASVGKHNFYVLLTRMSRFEFRDYQQCCSFFFFSLHSTFSCCSILAIERIRTRLTVKLSRVYIFLWIPKVENGNYHSECSIHCGNYRYPLRSFHFHQKKIELFFAEIFVDTFRFFRMIIMTYR